MEGEHASETQGLRNSPAVRITGLIPVRPTRERLRNASLSFLIAQHYIAQAKTLGVPVFETYLRENKTLFASAAEEGMPVVLQGTDYQGIRAELEGFVDEFVKRLGL